VLPLAPGVLPRDWCDWCARPSRTSSTWQHQSELQRIAELERTPLPVPSGLKSLGWKGDARFKNPEAAGSKGAASGASAAAAARPTQKRTPKEEAVKILDELLRDKEWVRKVEAKMRSKKSDCKDLCRIETHMRENSNAPSSPRPRPSSTMPPWGQNAWHLCAADMTGAGVGCWVRVRVVWLWRRERLCLQTRVLLRRGAARRAALLLVPFPSTATWACEEVLGFPTGWLVYVYMYVCMYMYLYVYTQTRTHAHTHTALLPTSYDSTSAWLIALVKIALAQILELMGVPVPSFLGTICSMYVCMWVRACVGMYVCMYVCMYMYIYIYIYIYIYMFMYMYLYICMYVYKYLNPKP